jgi:hypothetical protein
MKVTLGTLRESILESYVEILVEGRIEDARERYPDISDEDFDDLVENQPQGSNNKYLMWCAKQVDDGFSVNVVVQNMRLFDGNKQRLEKKDINQYEDPSAIETAVQALGGKSKSQESKQAKADSDVIYNDDHWLVIRPHTMGASCKYGIGTKWCIAATTSHNYFSTYSTSNNKFYFVIDKTQLQTTPPPPSSKYAIVIRDEAGRNNEAYDASDKRVPVSTVAKHVGVEWPAIWSKIEAHVKKVPLTREVEDEQRAVEEHVNDLMAGKDVSSQALQKIAKSAKMTLRVVQKVYDLAAKKVETGEDKYMLSFLMYALSDNIGNLTPDAAMFFIQKIGDGGNSYYIKRAIEHANLTEENFTQLVKSGNEAVIAAIMENPRAPDALKDEIVKVIPNFKNDMAKHDAWWALIKSGRYTLEQFKEAVESSSASHYHVVAGQVLRHIDELNLTPEQLMLIPVTDEYDLKNIMKAPNLPPAHLGALIVKLRDKLSTQFLIKLLKQSNIDSDTVELLWKSVTPDIRTALLQNPSIGASNASKFALSKNHAYRFAVAHNPVTPKEDLAVLAGDESTSTRAAVAANPNTPVNVLKQLSRDEAVAIRAAAASNAAVGNDVLQALTKDSDNFVRRVARKTLKSLKVAEAYVKAAMGMRRILLEELSDENENQDIMNPSWRDISTKSLKSDEFIVIFLLQNNGHATREEIESAWFDWMGRLVRRHDLWKSTQHGKEPVRGINASGSAWYWAPPGIDKGALFQLTPAGAAAAMHALNKVRGSVEPRRSEVGSAGARPGRTYYISNDVSAFDITGRENDEIESEEIEVNRYSSEPVIRGGKYTKLSPNRSRASRMRTKGAVYWKFTSPNGRETYTKNLPQVALKRGAEVTYVKAVHAPGSGGHPYNMAMVKYGDRYLLTAFPLMTTASGAREENAPENVAPPIKKSPPSKATAAAPAAAAAIEPTAAKGPKTTYKIYGRFKGHPAATRLKGQAYVAGQDTQFSAGEQAVISKTDDGKLKVKKADSDHSQIWEPIDG